MDVHKHYLSFRVKQSSNNFKSCSFKLSFPIISRPVNLDQNYRIKINLLNLLNKNKFMTELFRNYTFVRVIQFKNKTA